MQVTAEMQKMRNSGMSLEAIGRKIGRGKTTIQKAFAKRAGGKPATVAPKVSAPTRTVKLCDVIAPHDKVSTALSVIGSVPAGELLPDDALRADVGVSADRWRSVRGSARLAGHWYQLPDRTMVWGSKSTIAALAAKMKEIM